MRSRYFLKTQLGGLVWLVLLAGCLRINPVRGDVLVHDPSSIIKCKDEYWLFGTGKGIISRRSKDLVKWTAGPPVFTTYPGWAEKSVPGANGYYWAPEVVELNHKYLLYYSVSTWGKNSSAIGLAINTTLDPTDPNYHWTDCGMVIQSGSNDQFNAIDPCIFKDADSRVWLGFGSFWSGIKLLQIDPASGKRIAPGSPVYSLAHSASIEAPYIFRHNEFYYLFVNWGFCCRGVRSTYNVRVGRSRTITGPYLDKKGVDMLRGGGSLFLDREGSAIGPGHVGIYSGGGGNLLSYHYYDALNRGKATLRVRSLGWSADGWPVVAEQSSEAMDGVREIR